MKAKYRILEKNNEFYPQIRFFFIWVGFEELFNEDIYVLKEVKRKTLNEAKDFIQEYINRKEEEKNIKKYIKIHTFNETKNS